MSDETKPIWHDLVYWAVYLGRAVAYGATYAGQCLVLAVERQPRWTLAAWAASLGATWWWL
jgi:hypothetical protein